MANVENRLGLGLPTDGDFFILGGCLGSSVLRVEKTDGHSRDFSASNLKCLKYEPGLKLFSFLCKDPGDNDYLLPEQIKRVTTYSSCD